MYNAEQIGHNELPQKHNIEYLHYALGKSLERLQTSYVDVYSLHNPKMQAVTNKELFNELDNLVARGTIKSHDSDISYLVLNRNNPIIKSIGKVKWNNDRCHCSSL